MITLVGNILTSNGNNVLTAISGVGPNSEVALNTDRTVAGAWENFKLILLPGSPPIGPGMKFALQTSSGSNYLTAVKGGGMGGPNDATCPVHTDQTIARAGGEEIFTLQVNDGVSPPTVQIIPFFHLPLLGNHYLTAVHGGGIGDGGTNTTPVHTDAASIGAWEQFSFSPLPTKQVSTAPVYIAFNTNINGPAQGNIAGSVMLTIESDGSYSFQGQDNNSNWLPYNMAVVLVVVGKDGTGYAFAASGGIGAGVPFSNNNWNWVNNGINGAVQTNWNNSLGLGWSYYYNVSANLDAGTLLNQLVGAVNTVAGVIQTVIKVIGFFAS